MCVCVPATKLASGIGLLQSTCSGLSKAQSNSVSLSRQFSFELKSVIRRRIGEKHAAHNNVVHSTGIFHTDMVDMRTLIDISLLLLLRKVL